MHARVIRRDSRFLLAADAVTTTAAAYDQAGEGYLAYADGNLRSLYAFDSAYAYGDRLVWNLLESKLVRRRSTGARSIVILDAGCGPGTWLRRLVARAHALGFDRIEARGFDIAFVVADGLSAFAVNEHALSMLEAGAPGCCRATSPCCQASI